MNRAVTTMLPGVVLIGLIGCAPASPQPDTPAQTRPATIRINQLGYPPGGEKLAVVSDDTDGRFQVTDTDGEIVYRNELSAARKWPPSGETVRIADFSALNEPGRYRLHSGRSTSTPFEIREQPYTDLNRGALKAFYYNRAGVELDPEHAGRWARAAGHPDGRARIHPSAAAPHRPAGSTIHSPAGWYDAGDYNQYVVNSGISTYTLLAAYEHFPAYYAEQPLNIPESENDIPDILDEARWNLRWMLSMQDSVADGGDGGVYHKLTEKTFSDSDVLPHENGAVRYVVQKSTAATLDFAATMAACARVFENFEQPLPGFADRCRKAAIEAWAWARANPHVHYRQPDDIRTGAYAVAHEDFVDEWIWAAAELYLLTGADAYLETLRNGPPRGGVPHWEWSAPLAWVSLTGHSDTLPEDIQTLARSQVLKIANHLLDEKRRSAYAVTMGAPVPDNKAMYLASFEWGSNGNAANQALMLLQAYRITDHRPYLDAAQANMDYLLGRNAVGYSFVTGYGDRTPRHPHHRPSMADNVESPVPGFLVGGPHDGQHDAESCSRKGAPGYRSNTPAASYIDHACSYATNEVAINWNAPLVYISGALDVYY